MTWGGKHIRVRDTYLTLHNSEDQLPYGQQGNQTQSIYHENTTCPIVTTNTYDFFEKLNFCFTDHVSLFRAKGARVQERFLSKGSHSKPCFQTLIDSCGFQTRNVFGEFQKNSDYCKSIN